MRLYSPQNSNTPKASSPLLSPRDSGDIFMDSWSSEVANDQEQEYPSQDDSPTSEVTDGAVKRNFSFLSNSSSATPSASSSDTEETSMQGMTISNRLDDIMQCSNSGIIYAFDYSWLSVWEKGQRWLTWRARNINFTLSSYRNRLISLSPVIVYSLYCQFYSHSFCVQQATAVRWSLSPRPRIPSTSSGWTALGRRSADGPPMKY